MTAQLQHWSLCSRRSGEWQSPDEDGARIFGLVFGHPRHFDGKELLTSPVVKRSANRIMTRSGSEYALGPIDPAYERRYPGALQRLLARLGNDPMAPAPRRAGWISRAKKFLMRLTGKRSTS
jgi:hypothetical protein